MNKEQQIEEMGKIIDNRLIEANCWLGTMYKGIGRWIAQKLVEHYQPKLPEDSVVLSKEEYNNLKLQIQQAHNKGVQAGFDMTKFKEQSIRKQAVKEFAEKLKIKAITLTAIESYHICEFINELLKEY